MLGDGALVHSAGVAHHVGAFQSFFWSAARELLNATFLCYAAGAGLTSCIANPSARRVREAVDALKVLGEHDPHAASFIGGYAAWKADSGAVTLRADGAGAARTLSEAVLNGDKENVVTLLEADWPPERTLSPGAGYAYPGHHRSGRAL